MCDSAIAPRRRRLFKQLVKILEPYTTLTTAMAPRMTQSEQNFDGEQLMYTCLLHFTCPHFQARSVCAATHSRILGCAVRSLQSADADIEQLQEELQTLEKEKQELQTA